MAKKEAAAVVTEEKQTRIPSLFILLWENGAYLVCTSKKEAREALQANPGAKVFRSREVEPKVKTIVTF